jgi:hypothetical protein
VADESLQALRVEVCRATSEALDHCGRVLWCFGLADVPARRAIGIVTQIGGELGRAATSLLGSNSAYATAALLRQIVEVEYLLYLFATSPQEPGRWINATDADLRKWFQPAAMRRRSAGRFRDTEYWTHCETGGHPHPRGARLLLHEHEGERGPSMATIEWLWLDLSLHLARVWDRFAAAAARHDLVDGIAAVRASVSKIAPILAQWRGLDGFEGQE